MSDEAGAALDDFLAGSRTLEEVRNAIGRAIAADSRAAEAVLSKLDGLHKAGVLPPQVYRILSGAAGRNEPPWPAARAIEQPPQRSDLTETDSAQLGAGNATEHDPGTAADDNALRPKQRLQGAPTELASIDASVSAHGAALTEVADSFGAASRPETGSNWAHPEQWHSRHEGPVGPGSTVGRFLLEEEIGSGGMGVVYRAIDLLKQETRDPNPYVAVKILSDEFRQHPKALIALQREASKAQQLAHPNIITVHHFDRDGTAIYMTMELLEGEPLNRLISSLGNSGLPPKQALPLIRGMSEALAYAHKRGFAHCDFKPGNVFVKSDGDVKVLDFGIARAVSTELQPHVDHVFDAHELGALTKRYASPQMLARLPATMEDDVFALAIVAYELLTGQHPFGGIPVNELPANLKVTMPAGLSRRQRRALSRALELKREQRHPNARAFLAEFDGPGPVKKVAYATAAASLLVAAFASWHSMQLRPERPFDTLPLEAQQRFNDFIEQGKMALEINAPSADDDAFGFFRDAFDVHRNNPNAIAGLEMVADRVLSGLSRTDPENQQERLNKLYCQAYLKNYRPLRTACRNTPKAECSCTETDR